MFFIDTYRRPTSTKTRIETQIVFFHIRAVGDIADRHPLKQGLKHPGRAFKANRAGNRRPTSTKTRIETV